MGGIKNSSSICNLKSQICNQAKRGGFPPAHLRDSVKAVTPLQLFLPSFAMEIS